MNKFKLLIAAAAVGLLPIGGVSSANADIITYTLTDILLSDGGTLSGTFTTGVYGGLESFNLTTTAGSMLGAEHYYSPNTYVNYNSTPFSAPTVLDFFPNDLGYGGYGYELQLTFSSPVTSYGAVLLGGYGGPSFECVGFSCPSTDTRYLSADVLVGGGSITETPLPSTWVMMLAGLVGLGFIAYRRKSNATSFAAA